MRTPNNYFLAFVRVDARLTDWDVFPFDDTDEEQTALAWDAANAFRMSYERSARYAPRLVPGSILGGGLRPVQISLWRPMARFGPWQFQVGIVGKPRREVLSSAAE